MTPSIVRRMHHAFASLTLLAIVALSAPSSLLAATNLFPNPDLEAVSGNAPTGWSAVYWGTPTPTFTYPVAGHTGNGAQVSLASNSTGDARWQTTAPIAVTAGHTYTYSSWYKSDVATEVDVEYRASNGSVSYGWVTSLPATGGQWMQAQGMITVPANITGVTVYHILDKQGTLVVDDFSLTDNSGTPPATPTLTLSASPTSVTSGQMSTLTWSSQNADTCTASGGWTGMKPVSGSINVSPTVTTTYTLTCTGTGGTVTKSATVTVGTTPPPQPTLTFTASSTSITSGQSTTLNWSTQNATSCTASGGWSGTKGTSGSTTVSPTATTTYTLSCSGAGGSVTKSVTINVTPAAPSAPTLTLSASPTTITSGQSSTLTWSSQNATSCSASGGWSGSQSLSGSASVSPTATTTYTLSCSGAGGSVTKSATVSVTAPTPTQGGMISFSFDDAWASQYTNALPILEGAGFKGTFYILTEPVQGGWTDYMTPAQVQTIANHGHELGGHTITHVDLTGISTTRIDREIRNSKTYIQNLTGKTVTSLAYPYGSYNTTVINRSKLAGYTNGRTADPSTALGFNPKGQAAFEINSFSPNGSVSLAQVKAAIDQAQSSGQWFVFSFHEIGNNPDEYTTSIADFQAIVDYVKQSGIKVVTVSEGTTLNK